MVSTLPTVTAGGLRFLTAAEAVVEVPRLGLAFAFAFACVGAAAGAAPAGTGVIAGPRTYASLRWLTWPWGPSTSTGAAAAPDGKAATASRATSVLRTGRCYIRAGAGATAEEEVAWLALLGGLHEV